MTLAPFPSVEADSTAENWLTQHRPAMPKGAPFWDVPEQRPDAVPAGRSRFVYEGPDYSGNEWDTVWLNGIQLPGICSVDGGAQRRLDVQKANGGDGGVLIERGYVPGEYDVDILMWTPQQWSIWQGIVRDLFSAPGKLAVNEQKKGGASAADLGATASAALYIRHPALPPWVAYVVVTSVSVPRPGTESGTKVVTIKCTHWTSPNVTPVKVAPSAILHGTKGKPARDPRVPSNAPSTSGNDPPFFLARVPE